MPPTPGQPGTLQRVALRLDELPLERLLPSAAPEQPQLRGLLTMMLQAQTVTLDPAQLTRTLSANGHVKLTQPIIAHLNILRTVFERLSMIPGLTQTLEARLPQEYQAKLWAKDTQFSPIDLPIQIDHGVLRLDHLQVATDTLQLHGEGTVGLDGTIQIRSILQIEPALSAAIVRSMKELQPLMNANSELEIPAMIQGQAPHVTVLPDVHYVTSKVVVTTAVSVLQRLLEKRGQPSDSSTTPDSSTPSPEDDPLGQLLERALRKHKKE